MTTPVATRLLSRREVAEQLSMSTRTVDRLITDGLLVAHRFGRTIRISAASVAAFIEGAK